MTKTTEPAVIKPPLLPRRHRQDLEFLPAALEIVETPPSPIGRIGGFVLIAVFAAAIGWASVGRVDIVAVARGKIIPTGYTKIVQPFETGVVRAIHAHDGQKVKTGDILIELDPTMNRADLGHLESDLMAARIDIARLTAALRSANGLPMSFVAPAGATAEQAEMGRQVLLGQVSHYKSKLASLVGEEMQKRAEEDSLKLSISKIEALLPMMQERTQMRKTLTDHQNGSRIAYLENLQELVANQKELDVQTNRLNEAKANITEAIAKREEMQADYRRGILNDLAEAIRKASGLEQDVAKAEQRTRYQVLTAPIDGTVQQLAVHTVGGVVTPAQALLAIVPSDSKLEVEATVNNEDIGFVHPGQAVEIKVDTFNFTRYGLRHGSVINVSQDVVTRDRESKGDDGSAKASGGNSPPEQPAYAARVSLDRTQMKIENKVVDLSPGMGVNVEIKTGTRRIISYLLSPLLRYSQESMRER